MSNAVAFVLKAGPFYCLKLDHGRRRERRHKIWSNARYIALFNQTEGLWFGTDHRSKTLVHLLLQINPTYPQCLLDTAYRFIDPYHIASMSTLHFQVEIYTCRADGSSARMEILETGTRFWESVLRQRITDERETKAG